MNKELKVLDTKAAYLHSKLEALTVLDSPYLDQFEERWCHAVIEDLDSALETIQ